MQQETSQQTNFLDYMPDWEEERQYQERQYEAWVKWQQADNEDDDLFKKTGLRVSSIKDIRTAPPLQYIVQDLIIQGFIYNLAAPPGTGKSIFALSLARSMATRQPFLGIYQIIQPGLVLIVDSENSASLLRDHFDRMGISNDLPIEFLHFQDIQLRDDDSFRNLLRVIERKKPVLTVFDSMIRFHNWKENEPSEMKQLNERLHEIINLGSTVLALQHAPVNITKTHISRGTGEIPAGCDVEYGMVKDAHKIITFKSYKTRVGGFDPIRLKIIEPTSSTLDIVIADTYVNHSLLNDLKEELQNFIKQQGRSPNQTEFINKIQENHPNMKRKGILALIQDGIKGPYWDYTMGQKNSKIYLPKDAS